MGTDIEISYAFSPLTYKIETITFKPASNYQCKKEIIIYFWYTAEIQMQSANRVELKHVMKELLMYSSTSSRLFFNITSFKEVNIAVRKANMIQVIDCPLSEVVNK